MPISNMTVTSASDIGACFETSSITLEWHVPSVSELFTSTAGEVKSKAMKSPLFGNGSWQVLFYANAGGDHKDFSSVYLSAEPTQSERDPHGTGQLAHEWSRDGLFKFVIEIKAAGKPTHTIRSLEATDHQFTWKTANWGWTKYVPRKQIYPDHLFVKQSDAMLIVATVTHTLPVKIGLAPPLEPRVSIPPDLVKATGSLLNRPEISDVRFIIEGSKRDPQRKQIYAQKAILCGRSEYFQTMFQSSFAEGQADSEMGRETPSMTTVTITDTTYDTFHAMLFFLYTHRIKFTSRGRKIKRLSGRNSLNGKTNDVEMEEDDEDPRDDRDDEDREDIDTAIEEEDESSNPTDSAKFIDLIDGDNRPADTSEPVYLGPHAPRRAHPKALYRLADRYDLSQLTKRCFIHLTENCLSPRNAFMELVDSFAHDFPNYRAVVLEYVLKHWREVLDHKVEFDDVMRGGQTRFVGFAEAWAELAPRLRFESTEAMEP